MGTRVVGDVLLLAALVRVPVVAARSGVGEAAVVRASCRQAVASVAPAAGFMLGAEHRREYVGQREAAHRQTGADDGDVVLDEGPQCRSDVD